MSAKRSDRNNKTKRPKKNKTGRVVLIIFLVLLLGISLFGWKIYSDVTGTTDRIYKGIKTDNVRNKPVDIKHDDEPFSMLLLGVDTGDLGRTEKGRSDSLMVITVNPNTNQTTLLSVPRDTYTEIIGKGKKDKINHAYAYGGVPMSINTVQSLLSIPIDYYVEVNMQGIKDIVDTLGGVNVTSPLSFNYEGYSFKKNESYNLDGTKALAYSRMRYEDPNGDYGRQARQRQVINAAIKKTASFSTIMNYKGLLSTLENNMTTNLNFNDMVDIFNDYKDAAKNINEVQLKGSGTKMNGVYYEIISKEEINQVSLQLHEQLELE